jgi:hypothetical protein
LLRSRTRLIR